MAINLLDMLKSQIGNEIISKASSLLGESENNTRSAMGAALPSILGGLIQKGTTESGASGIMDLLSSGNFSSESLASWT